MNFRREGNESSGVHSSDPLLESERGKIVVKYKCPLCRHVMAVREVLHAEYGQLLCPKCVTRTTRYSLFCRINFENFMRLLVSMILVKRMRREIRTLVLFVFSSLD